MASNNNIKGCLLAFLGYSLYVAHDSLVKLLSPHYSVLQITFFSLIFCFPYLTVVGVSLRPERGIWPAMPVLNFVRMLLMVVAALSAFEAFATAPMVDVYTLLLTQPIFVALLSVTLLREKVSAARIFALLLGFAGTLVILRPGFQDLRLYHLLALTASLCYSFCSIILGKTSRRESLFITFFYPVIGLTIFSGISMVKVYVPLTLFHLALLMLQGLLFICASLVVTSAYRLASPSLVVPFQYVQLIWSVLIGLIVFRDIPDQATMLGSIMIVASGLFIFWSETVGHSGASRPILKERYGLGLPVEPEPMEILRDPTSLLINRQQAEKHLDQFSYSKSRFYKK